MHNQVDEYGGPVVLMARVVSAEGIAVAAKSRYASSKAVFQKLDEQGPTFFGLVKQIDDDDNSIMFAEGHNCRKWIAIPVVQIEEIERLYKISCEDHFHYFVRLILKRPSSPEGEVFSKLSSVLAETMPSVSPKLSNVPLGQRTLWNYGASITPIIKNSIYDICYDEHGNQVPCR